MLEEKIKQLGDRYVINGIYEGCRYVKVNIPLDWDISETYGEINAERDGNNKSQVIFGTYSPDINFSDIIDTIFEVIRPYLAILEKNELFNDFHDRLENIFKENDLETLKTLDFEFTGKQKRAYNKKSTIEPEKVINKRELLVENKELTETQE